MHLRLLRFTDSPFVPFTIKRKKIKKFKETGDSPYIFIKRYSIKLVFNMIWFIEILNI